MLSEKNGKIIVPCYGNPSSIFFFAIIIFPKTVEEP